MPRLRAGHAVLRFSGSSPEPQHYSGPSPHIPTRHAAALLKRGDVVWRRKATLSALALGFALSISAFDQSKAAQTAQAPAPTAKVDLNTSTQKELETLPGIGTATAKKIIAGRPYSSVAELARAGVSKRQIDQITPLVTISTSEARRTNRHRRVLHRQLARRQRRRQRQPLEWFG
jgi:hypothetical protein